MRDSLRIACIGLVAFCCACATRPVPVISQTANIGSTAWLPEDDVCDFEDMNLWDSAQHGRTSQDSTPRGVVPTSGIHTYASQAWLPPEEPELGKVGCLRVVRWVEKPENIQSVFGFTLRRVGTGDIEIRQSYGRLASPAVLNGSRRAIRVVVDVAMVGSTSDAIPAVERFDFGTLRSGRRARIYDGAPVRVTLPKDGFPRFVTVVAESTADTVVPSPGVMTRQIEQFDRPVDQIASAL